MSPDRENLAKRVREEGLYREPEWFIEKQPCSRDEFTEYQIRAQLLYGNVYQHSFTRPNGTLVVRALDPQRMMAADAEEAT